MLMFIWCVWRGHAQLRVQPASPAVGKLSFEDHFSPLSTALFHAALPSLGNGLLALWAGAGCWGWLSLFWRLEEVAQWLFGACVECWKLVESVGGLGVVSSVVCVCVLKVVEGYMLWKSLSMRLQLLGLCGRLLVILEI